MKWVLTSSSSSEPLSSLSDLGATSYLEKNVNVLIYKSPPNQHNSLSLANWLISKYKRNALQLPACSHRMRLTQAPGCICNLRLNSPWVHLEPGLQLPCFGGIRAREDLPTLHVDHFHRQVAHLAGLVQRLKKSHMHGFTFCDVHTSGVHEPWPTREVSSQLHAQKMEHKRGRWL